MKIALVILHADPARGGAERYTLDLARALATRGHDVNFLAADPPADLPGVTPVPLSHRGLTRTGRYRRLLDDLDGHLNRVDYDVIHAALPVRRCDVYHPHAGLAADAVANGHRKRVGAARAFSKVANRLNPRRQKFAAVERRLLDGERPPLVVSLSEYVGAAVGRHYPLDKNRQAQLFNAVDLGRFDPASRPGIRGEMRRRYGFGDDAAVALMIAQDFARKGLREAILALEQADDPRLRLLVVGRPDASAYRQLARQHDVEDRVVFAGATDDPHAFYRAADFFVLPTRHDPCSLVVLEALAMGLPVVSTAFNGACEVMTPGREGFVIADPGDVPALADSMRHLADPVRRAAMAAACLALRPRLSYEHHLDQLTGIYERAMSR